MAKLLSISGKATRVEEFFTVRDRSPFLPLSFGGIPKEFSSWEKSQIAVLPVPYDSTVCYQPGARKGPLSIIEASTHMELYDEELKKEIFQLGIHTLDQLKVTTGDPKEMVERIRKVSAWIINSNKFPVLLGGEHTTTLGMVRALKEKYPDLSVLQLDAHADLRDAHQESRYSHACVARRLKEICPVIQVGIRSLSLGEKEYLEKSSSRLFYASELMKNEGWEKEVISSLSERVYITIDLDVFDPSIMPAVGTPEPGGLGWYQALKLLRLVSLSRSIVGFDVVELCPIPGCVAPDFLAARLTYRLIGYSFFKTSED